MNQNICNICGANFEYRNGRWKCPACGAFKVDELSNEEITLLFNAAQKLRLCDFDEAEKAYSDIIEKFPENPNGYWGRLLSRYGIKYEEDFDGGKIPTCYATSIESVIDDKDYIKALTLADTDTKLYFEKQAQYIERVRKEWIERAKKEKPYDIFICYKDSDLANGIDRTQDSIVAQDLYIHLTEQGYRVFFSRESLRDKIGEKYEPYIFNALSTAKVMLVYGTNADYIMSTWMKNEWTRYEKRMQAGEKKPNSLMVVCDGFSPAELPKVLSSTQCFDATKRSFYTDLDAMLKRVIKGEKTSKPIQAEKKEKKTSKKIPLIFASLTILIAILIGMFIPNLMGNKTKKSIKDAKYGVVITASDSIFDKNSALIVDKLSSGEQYASIIATVVQSIDAEIKNEIIYDIECGIDIKENVTVKVPFVSSGAQSIIKVFYVSDDQALVEEHNCIYDNGVVEFKTNHLSYYVICEIESAQTPSNDTTDNNSGDNTGDNSTTPEPPVATKETTITFNANGGSGIMSDQTVKVSESAKLKECSFTNQGYTFGGWATSVDGSLIYTEGASFTAESEGKITLYAVWVPDSNSLIFNANGGSGSMESILIETNATIALPTNNFNKLGYTFVGWSESPNGTVKYTDCQSFKMTSSATVTLYAVWSAKTNSIQFNSNGGSGSMSAQQAKTAEKIALKQNAFTRNGYTFAGWSTSSSGAVVYKDKAEYTMGMEASVMLYAVWQPNFNKIVFNSNGGTGSMKDQDITTGNKANLTSCGFTREGFIFAGWATSPSGNVVYADQASYTMGENNSYTLYAVWIKAAFTITYHMNNGSNNVNNPAGYDVDSATIILADPTRDGYTFLGWFTDSNFQNKISSIPKGSTGNKTIYASWTANTNAINFDANGGSGSMSAQQAKTDEKITLKQNSFTREGYTFKGWSTSASGGIAYVDKAFYTMDTSSSVTLYAVWETITYTILYDLQGGSVSGNITSYNATTNSFTISNPTKTGYTFLGWSGTDINGMQKDVSINKGSIGNRSYTANWKANEYTVSFDTNGGSVSINSLKVTYNENTNYPTPDRQGYTFDGWYSGNTRYQSGKWLYTSDVTLKAKWTPNTNTSYTVKHYLENLNDNGYTLQDTQTLYGTTDVTVSPNTNTYTGFNAPSTASLRILADGSAVLEYHYTRVTHTITLITNGGASINPIAVKYQQTISLPNATRNGFTFGGWYTDVGLTNEFTQTTLSADKTVYAWWTEENKPGDFTYTISSSGTRVSGNNKSLTHLVIPSFIGGSEVNQILSDGFMDYTNLVSLTIPSTVVTIGKSAFKGCTNLSTLAIPEGQLATIDEYAFSNCSSLSNVVVPKCVTTMGASCFSGCSGLTEMTLPFVGKTRSTRGNSSAVFGHIFGSTSSSSGTTYQAYYFDPFSGTGSAKYYYIPKSITKVTITDATQIPIGAFDHCNFIKDIQINNEVTSIGDAAFCDTGITSFTIPENVTNLGAMAFSSSSIKYINMGPKIQSIPNYLFSSCGGLDSIYYDGTITQWNNMSKGKTWYYSGSAPTIYCTDGTVEY